MATEKKRGAPRPAKPTSEASAKPAESEAIGQAVAEKETKEYTIVIERRETVATITVEDDGPENAITLAFQTAAEYIVANVSDDKPIELEFEYGGMTYYAYAGATEGKS